MQFMTRKSPKRTATVSCSQCRVDRAASAYNRRLDRSLITALLLLIFAFLFLPKKIERHPFSIKPIEVHIVVQEIPATLQTVQRGKPRPEKPQIPLAVEDPAVPEDATIAETDLRLDLGTSLWGTAGLTAAPADTLLPRPVLRVMPDYPEEAKKLKRAGAVRLLLRIDKQGIVRQVIVAENTTGSEECASAAVDAAQRSTYVPGRIDNRPNEMWVICEYGFAPE